MRPLVFVFRTISRSCWNELLTGISEYAKAARWHLPIEERELRRAQSVRDLLAFWKPDGCLVEAALDVDGALDPVLFGRTPVVFINSEHDRIRNRVASVTIDSRKIGALAARELLSLDLAAFAFYGFSDFRWSGEREEGYAAALMLNGRTFKAFRRPFFQSGKAPTRNEPYRRKLVDWLLRLPKPCGIFSANDLLAEELIRICQKSGLAVPDDVAILGVDNDTLICDMTEPTLSSIQTNFFEEGRSAADMLGTLMRTPGQRRKRSVLFDSFKMVRRQSTRRLPGMARDVAQALEYIRCHACEGISSKDVLSLFSCSRRRAEQRFREETGGSILAAIQNVRMENARALLTGTHGVEDVAAQIGFSSSRHLLTLFRRQTGMSPREYRAKYSRSSAHGRG